MTEVAGSVTFLKGVRRIVFELIFINGPWSVRLAVTASVLNFLVFFGRDLWYRANRGQRHMVGQVKRFSDRSPDYFHKCAVCGITDTSHPETEFRYCSKCSGDLGYCPEHLHIHEHVRDTGLEG